MELLAFDGVMPGRSADPAQLGLLRFRWRISCRVDIGLLLFSFFVRGFWRRRGVSGVISDDADLPYILALGADSCGFADEGFEVVEFRSASPSLGPFSTTCLTDAGASFR